MSSPTLDGLRDAFQRYGSPVIVFNKSHSGSRMLAQLLDGAGIAMGAHLNESWDSLDVLELVEYLVTRYYPDYSPLWQPERPADRELQRLIGRVFERHLEGVAAGRRWGWKLCETVFILPVLDYCFPAAGGPRCGRLVRARHALDVWAGWSCWSCRSCQRACAGRACRPGPWTACGGRAW